MHKLSWAEDAKDPWWLNFFTKIFWTNRIVQTSENEILLKELSIGLLYQIVCLGWFYFGCLEEYSAEFGIWMVFEGIWDIFKKATSLG